jgi:membrane associated rhomboid family serine protease
MIIASPRIHSLFSTHIFASRLINAKLQCPQTTLLITKFKKWTLFSKNVSARLKYTNLKTSMKAILTNSFRLFKKRTDRNSLRYAPRPSSSPLLLKFKKWSDPIFNDPNKLVWAIIGINSAIYLLWNYAFLQGRSNAYHPLLRWMVKNFTTSSQRLSNWWTFLTSNFSHQNFWHLLTNMYMIHQFCPYIIQVLGARQFFGFYIASCLSSSLFSIFSQLSLNRPANSLGASGCVTGTYLLIFSLIMFNYVSSTFFNSVNSRHYSNAICNLNSILVGCYRCICPI